VVPLKVVFIAADKDREQNLAKAFLAGVQKGGDIGEIVYKGKDDLAPDGDVFCIVGVKSHKLFRRIKDAGKHVVFFDKGYFRHRGPQRTWEYWRVAVNTHHPTDYVGRARHGEQRWLAISKRRVVRPKDWRAGEHVIFAGSSEKYHNFCGLPNPTEYAADIVRQIKKHTNRMVIYRPKPTWMAAEPVRGASFSGRADNLYDLLQRAHCLVTNGSNAGFDAVLEGVPTIVLGEAITRPISSTDLRDVDNPYLAPYLDRDQWLYNIAWCMFTEAEMADGMAWQAVRPQLFGEVLDDSEIKIVAGQGMKPSKALLKKNGIWKKAWKKAKQKPGVIDKKLAKRKGQ
jgi:hypothetical protein